LWHGASWNFVLWGLIHGAFLAAERSPLGRWLAAAPRAIQSLYTLGVVGLAWVFFRTDDLGHAMAYLSALAGLTAGSVNHPLALYSNGPVPWALAAAALSALPLFAQRARAMQQGWEDASWPLQAVRFTVLFSVLILCAMALVMGTHNPFIYFRF